MREKIEKEIREKKKDIKELIKEIRKELEKVKESYLNGVWHSIHLMEIHFRKLKRAVKEGRYAVARYEATGVYTAAVWLVEETEVLKVLQELSEKEHASV